VTEPRRASALQEAHAPGLHGAQGGIARVAIAERRGLTLLLLRGKSSNPAIADAVRAATGIELPVQPNTTATSGASTLLWLGPDEWLLSGEVARDASAALVAGCAALVDVSHGRTVIRVSGVRAREMLAKGLPIDLHPRTFGPGRCAQSALARCNVLVHQTDDAPTFDLYVMRSYGRSLMHFLCEAGEEFGYSVGSGD